MEAKLANLHDESLTPSPCYLLRVFCFLFVSFYGELTEQI
jgi:hypothetical protein